MPKLPRSVGSLLLVLLTAAVASLHSQSSIPVSTRLRFEVASVKPVIDQTTASGPSSPTHFFREDIELRYLMVFAYDLPEYRVVGGPEWIDSAPAEVDCLPFLTAQFSSALLQSGKNRRAEGTRNRG